MNASNYKDIFDLDETNSVTEEANSFLAVHIPFLTLLSILTLTNND